MQLQRDLERQGDLAVLYSTHSIPDAWLNQACSQAVILAASAACCGIAMLICLWTAVTCLLPKHFSPLILLSCCGVQFALVMQSCQERFHAASAKVPSDLKIDESCPYSAIHPHSPSMACRLALAVYTALLLAVLAKGSCAAATNCQCKVPVKACLTLADHVRRQTPRSRRQFRCSP